MFEKTARVVAIVTALFLCPISSEGMDLPNSVSNSARGIDKENYTRSIEGDPHVSVKKSERILHCSVNKELEMVVGILKSKLGKEKKHKIIA